MAMTHASFPQPRLFLEEEFDNPERGGPPGVDAGHAPPTRADRNLFVVVGESRVLFLANDIITPDLVGKPTVDATFTNGVWVPAG
jgi:hypothetical protein